ncbi:efflux RND transporter permease subunit [Eubacterium xylanophilum]|uniref:efflux RND transporter permease subunit n=1 Tax=Eubacterium xylanophilum TaxID=39497 RepID=UPI00047DA7A3|nr:efflux RND transporter permease subunit [Eubacterium xylanophilum]
MLSKLSVKKPYTVLVAVVLIITLGYLSFRNMSTDLLPDMDLPYAIVMTTYPGASPEEIENSVTRPVEQGMASITNVKQVRSMSNSNYSVVIMEFNDGADMDTATIDMREKLDQVSAQWDDAIGNPTIMKISPDMMPIMVAALDIEGMDRVQLTDKAKKDIIPELESVEGVASLNVSGQVDKEIKVIIQQDKIDAINKKVEDAIEGKMEKAGKKLDKGKEKIKDGKDTISEQQEKTAEKFAQGEEKLEKSSAKIKDTLEKINAGITQVKDQEKKVLDSEKKVKAGLVKIKTEKTKLLATIKTLTTTQATLKSTKDSYDKLVKLKEGLEAQRDATGETTDIRNQLNTVNAQIGVIEGKLKEQGMSVADLGAKLTEVTKGLAQANKGKKAIETQETKLNKTLTQIETGKKKIIAGKNKLYMTKKKLEQGQISINDANNTLRKQKVLATIKLSVAESDIKSGEAKINDALKTFKDTKKTTKEKSDLGKIITKSMVEGILTAENFEMPAGTITEDKTSYLVKVGEKVESDKDLGDMVIVDMGLDDLDPIKLSDVADVVVSDNSKDVFTIINGNPGIAIVAEKSTGYSTGDVSKNIKKKFDELEKANKGLSFTPLMDQGVYIDMVVDSVMENLLIGGGLAIIILLLFLWDIRPTIIVACSIPLSVVAAIVAMYFSGVTLNIISLSGLALGVGMLVDNSVVVIENIFRLRNEEGYSMKQASIEGARQVAGAILASTLTTVCVFAPIVFTEGITRQLFADLALTLAYSLLASLIVSLTLVPAMSQGMLRKKKEGRVFFIDKLQKVYAKLLRPMIRFKPIVFIVSIGLLVLFIALAVANGTAFMPEMGGTQMTATISPPDDNKGMDSDELNKISKEVIKVVEDINGVQTVGAFSGGASVMSMSSSGGASVSMYILLDETTKRTTKEIKSEIDDKTKNFKCKVDVQDSAISMGSAFGSGVTIEVKGKDLDKLKLMTEEIMDKIQGVKGVAEVSNGLEIGQKEYRITVNKAKAMEHTLTVAQVFQKINEKIKEATSATTISTDLDDLDVYVSHASDSSMSQKDLKNMKIEYTDTMTQKTKKVKLSKIATFEVVDAPSSINRKDQTRYMEVTVKLDEDSNIGLVSADLKKALEDYKAPDGYKYEFTGEDKTINESMEQVGLMMVCGVLFMYLIMVAQFQSLLSPFIILFTIPLAFTGGFMGLWISGSEVSVIAMIGFVMLSGIIVNNGIVLVDYINQLREAGKSKIDAIVEAGVTRLRPILMTAITTILGLVPMVVSQQNGSDMVRPMAIVTIGGLIYGTLLTLFVVPCIYAAINRKKYNKERKSK